MTRHWRCLLVFAVIVQTFVVSSALDEDNCTGVYHIDGPRINPCLKEREIILQYGQNFTMKCRGKTAVNLTQQVQPEEVIGQFHMIISNTTYEFEEYKYEVTLDLINVDQYAIGYYGCYDLSLKTDVLNNLVEEPNNTKYVSYMYVYVNGTGNLLAPMMEIVTPKADKVVLECRPTTPDVEVTLNMEIAEYIYSPKIGFILDSHVLNDFLHTFNCGFKKQGRSVDRDVFVKQIIEPPQPTITGDYNEFMEGEHFTLNCTVEYIINYSANLNWIYPENVTKTAVIEDNNINKTLVNRSVYSSITISNATRDHEGTYTCVSSNNCGLKNAMFHKTYLEQAKLNVGPPKPKQRIETGQKIQKLFVVVNSYPPARFTYYKNYEKLPEDTQKFEKSYNINNISDAVWTIKKLDITDTGIYTLEVSNGYKKTNVTWDLQIQAHPNITKFSKDDKKCVKGQRASLTCEVTGYPLPEITWIYMDSGQEMPSTNVTPLSSYKEIAELHIPCVVSGNIACKAKNTHGNEHYETQAQRRFLVYEMDRDFGIFEKNNDKSLWFPQTANVTVKCLASKYDYDNVTWMVGDDEDSGKIVSSENSFSHIAKLNIGRISLKHTGNYRCRGIRTNGTEEYDDIYISVLELLPPIIKEPIADRNQNIDRHLQVVLNCTARGVPLPEIKWYKDGDLLVNNSNGISIYNFNVDRKTVNSSINIGEMQKEKQGKYECVAINEKNEEQRKAYVLALTEVAFMKYLIPIIIIICVLILLVAYLAWKNKKEKQFRKELLAAGLLYFKEGVTKSLNPDLGIDEQAELLPYDDKFEFPPEKLTLGKQLGAGAFGVVYKAEARGIINAEQTTPVAVKMVKKTADNMYIKALASELKIMVHLGKHINIVNLLGACTKNVGKRELVVIVEYCKFGNIHNYMQRHRDVFIDQLTDSCKEKNFGKVNRGFSSSISTGAHSDYFGSTNSQETDHTTLNTANTNLSGRKNTPNNQATEVVKVSEGYVQPDWRSNYESDYIYDGRTPRPLTSRDLLAWAFQIARGMEYLAGRKVLHGDLAARNILLADDNIVKICDFGLAKSIYKNDEYQKKENSLLPVKWLAIECMTDRIFSTQSDVWSFGIVLWELFSLAKTPYPNISPSHLLQFLSEGHRLDKPTYADDQLYNLMNRCWEQKPTARPSFSQLQEIIGTFLEDNVRNHYVDLNAVYMDTNVKSEGQEDYLAMVSAPDYNNLVTPSPHHYVNNNRSFFPPSPTKVDDEGYLQMSPSSTPNIFSPKPTGERFDFEPRKFNSRASEASTGGSELTPMLTLNNLPARNASESDHEGNTSPYLNLCPRIDEETDEVFEIKQNNAKNTQNSAVTNPTYITFNADVEKKPRDINNYANIIPNGLVK